MRAIPLATALTLIAAGLSGAAPTAASPPNLAGVWELDGFMGAAPLGFPNERAVCAGTAGPAPAGGPHVPAEQMTPIGTFTAELTIDQTATAITIDRRYGGSMGSGRVKGVYRLDGSESENTVGALTSHTKSTWDGAQLVTEGRLAATTGRASSACAFRETLELGSDGALRLVASGDIGGQSRTSRQTYFAKKKR